MTETSVPKTPFGEIAQRYAEDLFHLEFARHSYITQRNAIVSELASAINGVIADSPLQAERQSPTKERGKYWIDTGLIGEYYAARLARSGKKKTFADGHWFGFATDEKWGAAEPKLAFRGGCWFRMGAKTFEKLRPILDKLAAQHGCAVRREKNYTYLQFEPVLPEDFDPETFRERVLGLHEMFMKADPVLAEAYREAWVDEG